MKKAPIELRDLRRRIYVKAKAEPEWRFWGLFVHVCKVGTLREAYVLAKRNNGSPGIDGVTFETIEAGGVESFLEQIREELVTGECGAEEPETGDTEGRGQGPRTGDTCNPGPGGAGSAQADSGADFRG